MNRLDVWIDDASLGGSAMVGHLTKTASRTGDTISFEYDAGWLAGAGPVAAFPLDHALHLGAGPHYAKAGVLAHGPGHLLDLDATVATLHTPRGIKQHHGTAPDRDERKSPHGQYAYPGADLPQHEQCALEPQRGCTSTSMVRVASISRTVA